MRGAGAGAGAGAGTEASSGAPCDQPGWEGGERQDGRDRVLGAGGGWPREVPDQRERAVGQHERALPVGLQVVDLLAEDLPPPPPPPPPPPAVR